MIFLTFQTIKVSGHPRRNCSDSKNRHTHTKTVQPFLLQANLFPNVIRLCIIYQRDRLLNDSSLNPPDSTCILSPTKDLLLLTSVGVARRRRYASRYSRNHSRVFKCSLILPDTVPCRQDVSPVRARNSYFCLHQYLGRY